MAVKFTVTCTPAAEGIITALPRYGEWEIQDEDYPEEGNGTVVFLSHRWNHDQEVPLLVEQALNTHPGVVSYVVEPA